MKKRILGFLIFSVIMLLPVITSYAATYLWPAPGVTYITTYYSQAHPGIDIAANGDHEVVAAREGTVKAASSTACTHLNTLGDNCNWGMGNYVQVQHSDGTYSTYMHMRYGSITVSVGQYVAKGTKLGMMGSSGNSSGQHLHFQLGTSATNTINVNPNALDYDYSIPTPDNRCCFQVTATDGINIRNGAGTSNAVIGAIPYNAYFYITERKQANGYVWGKVDNYNGVSGWCVLNYAKHVSGTLPVLKTDEAQPIHTDNNAHVRNGFFTFRNVASNKAMQVYAGTDKNEQPIDMWDFDGSIDQRFNVVHKGNGKYKLYAECSSDGNNRVVDIYRNGASITEGQKIELWTPDDDTAQLFYIWPVSDGQYVFEIAAKQGYVICPSSASAATKNGYDKGSQLVVQKYTGADYQKWKLCNNNGKVTTPNISYTAGSYIVDTDGDPVNLRSGASTTNSLIGSVPDKTTIKVTQVNGNWGYTNYNGKNGWICLDFTTYTVTIESISVSKKPEKLNYLVGEQLETLGMQITARYSNGQTENITTGFEVNGDLRTAGRKNISVSYKGKTTSFTVDVMNIEIKSIDIQNLKLKTKYYVDERIQDDEISLLAEYNDGTFKEITDGYDLSYDFSTPGTKTVTVSYGGKTTSYDVEVMSYGSDTTEKASFSISDESGYNGSTVIVPIRLDASNVYDGNMTIQYDASKLSIENVQAVGALSDRQVTINKEYAADKIRVSFSGTTPINSNGTILNLEFKALDNAQGTAAISIAEAKAYNKSGGAIVTDTSDGSVQITAVANNVTVTNIQSVSQNGRKVVTANVSDDRVMCYLVAYQGGVLVKCDSTQPSNGTFEVSVEESPNTQYKLMVWNMAMKPMINAVGIY